MELWLIYRNYYENNNNIVPQSMCATAEKIGIKCKIFFENYFSLLVTNGELQLYYSGEKVEKLPDAVFFRCYNFDVMDYFQQHNVKLVNTLRGMKLARSKFETHKLANSLNILQPKTIRVFDCEYEFIAKQLGSPFVLKDNSGQKGENVYLIYNKEQFLASKSKCNDIICQEFIAKSKGKDVRLYIVGEQVVGAVERVSQTDDFRSNISQGGIGREISVPSDINCTAVELAKKMGLSVCCVDFLISDNDFYMDEVNGNASFTAFLELGYDMPTIIMEYISKMQFNQ